LRGDREIANQRSLTNHLDAQIPPTGSKRESECHGWVNDITNWVAEL
jgi:hypothetical protein